MSNFNLRTLFVVNAVVGLVYALGLLLGPKALLGLYGLSSGTTEVLLAQFFGAALLAIGLISWFARELSDPTARDGIAVSIFLADAVSFVVALLATLSHVMQGAGWSAVVIYLVLGAGFGYFRFIDRSGS